MKIHLVLVSRLSWSIITQHDMHLSPTARRNLNEIYDSIHKIYPTLTAEEDYSLYWCMSPTKFLLIDNYMDLSAFFNLTYKLNIIMLIDDCKHHCFHKFTKRYLEYLDKIELNILRYKLAHNYDKADLSEDTTSRTSRFSSVRDFESLDDPSTDSNELTDLEKDNEVLKYAMRFVWMKYTYCTIEEKLLMTYVKTMKQGYPKLEEKERLKNPPDEIYIEQQQHPSLKPDNKKKAKKA